MLAWVPIAGYTLQEKAIKNASQEEVDRAYLKCNSSMSENIGASNLMSNKDMQNFMAKGAAASSSVGDRNTFVMAREDMCHHPPAPTSHTPLGWNIFIR